MRSSIATFDRLDIVNAYYCYAVLYHDGQWSKEYALHSVFQRLQYKPGLYADRPEALSENARAIFDRLVETGGADIRDRT